MAVGLLMVPVLAAVGVAGPLPAPVEQAVQEFSNVPCVDDALGPTGVITIEYPCPQYEAPDMWGCPFVLSSNPVQICEPFWYFFDFAPPEERDGGEDYYVIRAYERGPQDDVEPNLSTSLFPVLAVYGGQHCWGPQGPATLWFHAVAVCDDAWIRVYGGTSGWLVAESYTWE